MSSIAKLKGDLQVRLDRAERRVEEAQFTLEQARRNYETRKAKRDELARMYRALCEGDR